ncbi:MAG: imidazole glycerol phosphate synthase subunit HisH [Clostridia bacterium]|nr:imidazole glycerol phosphate synthase subunit HisH [Clostridia bacterium]
MIAIIDYGVGNLFSLRSSLAMIGTQAEVTADPARIAAADRLILPGVGAFGDARAQLAATGLDRVVKEAAASGKMLMGICLGMQLLFEKSYEFGEHEGLGLIPGQVVDMTPRITPGLKVPHIGWNGLEITKKDHPLMRGLEDGDCVYFVHSYCAVDCADSLVARTEYGGEITAAVARGNVCGCQFHPEKSGRVGLQILRSFCEMEG